MPLYEYECQACGDRTEVLQRVGAPAIGACEACGGEMKKLLSAPAFQFKGTGWYVTDYARKSSAPEGESQRSKEGSESNSKDSESKPKESGEAKAGTKDKASSQSTEKKPSTSS